MESWGILNFSDCQLGDKRLNKRALLIGKALDQLGKNNPPAYAAFG